MQGKDIVQTTNRSGDENRSGKQNRKDSASKAVGVGSSPTARANKNTNGFVLDKSLFIFYTIFN